MGLSIGAQRRPPTQGGGVPQPSYLPTTATVPSGAYGISKLVSGYGGPSVRVVRASDNAEQDIGFAGDILDVASATAFQGASSLTVKIWYDQVGTNHLTQPTQASQPTLYLGSGGPAITSYQTSKPLLIPSSLAIERANNSVFMATRTPGLGATNAFWMFGDASNLDYGLTTPRVTNQLAMQPMVGGASSASGATNARANAIANMSLVALVSSASKMTVHRDSQTCDYPAAASRTLSLGGQVGAGFTYSGRNDMRAFVVYPAALSDADTLAVKSALQSICGTFSAAARSSLFTGDSIIFGTGGINNRTITAALSEVSPTLLMRNTGIAGHRLGQHYTDFAANNPTRYLTPGVENVFVADYGHNDIKGYMDEGMSGADVLAQMQTQFRAMCTDLRANAQFDKIVWQEAFRDVSAGWSAGMETVRQQWNTWLASDPLDNNGVRCLNGLDKVATDAAFILSDAETAASRGMALTANSSDGIHPNESAAPQRAAHVLAAINAAVSTPLAISGTPVTTANQNSAYAGFLVTARYGTPPYSFSLASGTLPAGMTLNAATGSPQGTPTTVETRTGIVIRVTDVAGATANLPAFQIAVSAPQQVVIASTTVSQNATDGTALAIAMPATVNAGDVLFAVVASDGNSAITWDNVTAGAWTASFNDVQTSNRLLAFSKIADGTEGGKTLAVTIAAAQQAVAFVRRYTGAQGALSFTATGSRGSGTTVDAPAVTATWGVANNLYDVFLGLDNFLTAGGSITPPTGYGSLQAVTTSASGQATLAAASKVASSGSDDPDNWSWPGTCGFVALTVAVRPS
jgi:lysophospholipase L1-like esterase